MALIKWTERLSVGVPKIDEEHKKLVEMINSLHEAMRLGNGKEVLAKILDECTAYVLTHFANEEKLMVQYKYPEYKDHKAVHDEFVKKVVELRKQHDQQLLQSNQLLKVLQDWLVNHITSIDKRYGPLLMEAMKK
ncbi:MAG: bacteriohemerythrin [Negativicutes bacterium]|nr:bacteriohemerythrin [Negativicutes bacterium]